MKLTQIPGLGPSIQQRLEAKGIRSLRDLIEASDEDLTSIRGISADRAKKYRAAAKMLLEPTSEISGVGSVTARSLKNEGIDSVSDVVHADPKELAAINGIGDARAAALKEAASSAVSDALDDGAEDAKEALDDDKDAKDAGGTLDSAEGARGAPDGAEDAGEALDGAEDAGEALDGAEDAGEALDGAEDDGEALGDAEDAGEALDDAEDAGEALDGAEDASSREPLSKEQIYPVEEVDLEGGIRYRPCVICLDPGSTKTSRQKNAVHGAVQRWNQSPFRIFALTTDPSHADVMVRWTTGEPGIDLGTITLHSATSGVDDAARALGQILGFDLDDDPRSILGGAIAPKLREAELAVLALASLID